MANFVNALEKLKSNQESTFNNHILFHNGYVITGNEKILYFALTEEVTSFTDEDKEKLNGYFISMDAWSSLKKAKSIEIHPEGEQIRLHVKYENYSSDIELDKFLGHTSIDENVLTSIITMIGNVNTTYVHSENYSFSGPVLKSVIESFHNSELKVGRVKKDSNFAYVSTPTAIEGAIIISQDEPDIFCVSFLLEFKNNLMSSKDDNDFKTVEFTQF